MTEKKHLQHKKDSSLKTRKREKQFDPSEFNDAYGIIVTWGEGLEEKRDKKGTSKPLCIEESTLIEILDSNPCLKRNTLVKALNFTELGHYDHRTTMDNILKAMCSLHLLTRVKYNGKTHYIPTRDERDEDQHEY